MIPYDARFSFFLLDCERGFGRLEAKFSFELSSRLHLGKMF